MQNGSIIKRDRKKHSVIWQFRWWDKTSDGRRFSDVKRLELSTTFRTLKLLVKQQACSCRI
jgi:hypothetical protein